MPATLTYPGVYVDELPSAVRTITGVPTSTAAFVGTAPRGPADEPTHITSWADYQRAYGGLSADSLMSYSVYQFFQNGGSEAEVVRLVKDDADTATLDLGDGVKLTALSAGAWANSAEGPPPAGLRARVDYDGLADNTLFNLTVRDMSPGGGAERYAGIETAAGAKRTIDVVLRSSALVASTGNTDKRPGANDDPDAGKDPFLQPEADKTYVGASGGGDGAASADVDYLGDPAAKTGLNQLLKTDIFNLLCVLPPQPGDALPDGVLDAALELCVTRRALLLVDPPAAWTTIEDAVDGAVGDPPVSGDSAKNAAIFFPRVSLPDPLDHGAAKAFPPSGAMAGVMARTDAQRGVWKAPAGIDASLNGARGPDVHMTDLENGRLNPLGVNCIRRFPLIGTVSWGSRTMRGADALADQWKYIPVRRLALFIEESLFRGTKWVVFEPNDEPLWSSVRLNVGAFMSSLFRQGAFQGRTAREAYLVKCDKENNPQNDIDRGIVNILVGFAPLKPAEFVLIHIQQLNPAPLV
jgi:phage tail sheath protein FI